jgi:hypothetical protein
MPAISETATIFTWVALSALVSEELFISVSPVENWSVRHGSRFKFETETYGAEGGSKVPLTNA